MEMREVFLCAFVTARCCTVDIPHSETCFLKSVTHLHESSRNRQDKRSGTSRECHVGGP
jgi:hypothetical protein